MMAVVFAKQFSVQMQISHVKCHVLTEAAFTVPQCMEIDRWIKKVHGKYESDLNGSKIRSNSEGDSSYPNKTKLVGT